MKEKAGFVPPLWAMCAESVSSLLIMINFSGNFLIYCSVLKPFQTALYQRCTRKAPAPVQTAQTPATVVQQAETPAGMQQQQTVTCVTELQGACRT